MTLLAEAWPPGNGEMAERIRSHPWHRSCLGASNRWPPHLRVATNLMLSSPLPTLILTGVDGIVLYNDAFVSHLGSLHPALLGAAMSARPHAQAARFHALEMELRSGETLIADDNWLGLPDRPEDGGLIRLACSALRSAKGDISGTWVQMLSRDGRRQPEPSAPSSPTVTATGLSAWVWRPADRLLHLTNNAANVLGLLPARRHAFASPHFEFVHPLDQGGRSAAIEEAIAGADSYRHEFRILRPCDQEVAWIEERGHAVRDPRSGTTLMSAVLWEISDRKRAFTDSNASDDCARYAAALEMDTVGIAFFGPDGRITEANRTYCTLHGFDRTAIAAGEVRWGDGTAEEWRTLLRRSMFEYEQTGLVLLTTKNAFGLTARAGGGFSARSG